MPKLPRWRSDADPDLSAALNALADAIESGDTGKIIFSNDFIVHEDFAGLFVEIGNKPEPDAVEEEWYPWKAYPSPYVGTGTAPTNQADRWRIACGIIDGSQAPTNRNDEFVLDAEGDNWIWLHLLFAPTLLLMTIELRSGPVLEEGYFSEDGEALVIVPIFHTVKDADAAAGVYSLKVQHAKRDMTSTKVLVAADCAMRRMRPALSSSA